LPEQEARPKGGDEKRALKKIPGRVTRDEERKENVRGKKETTRSAARGQKEKKGPVQGGKGGGGGQPGQRSLERKGPIEG